MADTGRLTWRLHSAATDSADTGCQLTSGGRPHASGQRLEASRNAEELFHLEWLAGVLHRLHEAVSQRSFRVLNPKMLQRVTNG